ncbi:MAG TPA: MFS transporter [Burkholderiales bacterium]|nr:MFS transporter [Burkholderiales bacterium]
MSLNFVLALALLNMSSMRAGRVLLVLYALQLGAAPATVGLLAATFSAFPALLSWHAGKLADRFGSRWLLVIGAVGGGLGILIPFFWPGMTAIFIAAAANGVSLSIYNVSLQNVVGLLSTPQNRTQSFSNYSLTNSVGALAGPLIAGFSIEHLGHQNSCIPLALVALMPLCMLAIWGGRLPRGRGRVKDEGGGIRDMLASKGVSRTLATSSLLQTGQDLFQFYLPVYAHGVGLSASAIGVVLAMNSAAAFVVRLGLARLIARYNEDKVLAWAFFVGAASFALLPLFSGPVMLGVVAFAFGLGMGCGQPIVTMQMFSNSVAGRSGEALGLRMAVNHLTRVVGPVIFGFVGSAFGLPAVFWVNGLMLGGGGALSRTRETAGTNDKK